MSGGLPQKLPKVGQCGGVLGEPSVAEASRRHVAPQPWRVARKQSGLASHGMGRDGMSEAGPSVMSRGGQWRPVRFWVGESQARTAGPVGGRRSGSMKPEPW